MPGSGFRFGVLMFERYTEQARRVLFFSRYEASQLGSVSIEAEHLVLAPSSLSDQEASKRLIEQIWLYLERLQERFRP